MATILLVEDNPSVARMMVRLLQAAGHVARVAPDGPAALIAAWEPPEPDLILMDMMMPDMDGLEVLRRLRVIEVDTHQIAPPVIMFSAMDDPKVIEAALRGGAKEYWVKASFSFEEMGARIEKHLLPERANRAP